MVMWEWKYINGLVYARNTRYGKFWNFDVNPPVGVPADAPLVFQNFPTERRQRQANDKDAPTVICDCGNDQFTLYQENYDTQARCTKCKLQESVHSD
jgi:hypothetical protein